MDGMSGVDIISDRHALSPLTLALLEDSGWYSVNWDIAVGPAQIIHAWRCISVTLGISGMGERCWMFLCNGFL